MKMRSVTRILILACIFAALLTVSVFAYDVQGGIVTTNSAVNFRKEPSTDSASIGKLYNDTRVAILDEAGGWYKVAYQGTVGYMSADYVAPQPIMNIECGGAKVTTAVLNMRSAPGTENSIVTKLYEGKIAKIIGINNGWFKVQYNGNTGYISPDYVTIVPYTASSGSSGSSSSGSTSSANGTRQEIIDYAADLLGCKYVYGGTSPSGFDCSGFTQYVFAHFGVSLSHSSATQYSNSVRIKKSELKPGDLVFFSQTSGSSKVGHVGIYVGDGQFIHAASPGKGVRYDGLDDTYYVNHYIGCGRVLSD
ncbi:MAG: C40 family peptidase [Clostridia bacterium]|nr:C40 family peptidase [Clostridia bacterium]